MLNVYTFLSTLLSITDWHDVAAPSGKAAIGPFGDIVEKIFGRVVIGNPGHGRAGPAGREAMNGALDHQEFLVLAGGACMAVMRIGAAIWPTAQTVELLLEHQSIPSRELVARMAWPLRNDRVVRS